jgi:hypothetical protein
MEIFRQLKGMRDMVDAAHGLVAGADSGSLR